MADSERPGFDLAQKTLPPALLQALLLIFEAVPTGPGLVGGTALAGFYAGHRRSDDLDLFTPDDASFEATIRAVKSLTRSGVILHSEFRSRSYYKATAEFEKHSFTVDIVHDANVFAVGHFITLPQKLVIASLETILKMKCATLISRCSEKDLYDLLWLFERFPGLTLDDILRLGW